MPTAVKPLTLSNNTIADANDVEAIVGVLYTAINALDSANINLGANFPWTGIHTFAELIRFANAKGIADINGNEILTVLATASAVNHVNLTNAATGNAPVIEPSGDDSNIELSLQGKGAKIVKFKAARAEYVDKGDSGTGTITFDWTAGNTQRVRATGNFTIAFSNPTDSQKFTLLIRQDATGSRTVTWPTTVRWLNATGATDSTTDKPTLTTTANKVDIFSFMYDSALGLYWGSVVGFKGAIS